MLTLLCYKVPNVLKCPENQVKLIYEIEVQHDEWQLKELGEGTSVFFLCHFDSWIKTCSLYKGAEGFCCRALAEMPGGRAHGI